MGVLAKFLAIYMYM